MDKQEQKAVLGQPEPRRERRATRGISTGSVTARPAPARPGRSRRRCAGRPPTPRRCGQRRSAQPAGDSPTSHHHNAIVWRPSKNERADLAGKRRDRVAVDAHDVDRIGRRVRVGVGKLGVLTTRRDQLCLDRQGGYPAGVQPGDQQPRGLAEPELRGEEARHVDAPQRLALVQVWVRRRVGCAWEPAVGGGLGAPPARGHARRASPCSPVHRDHRGGGRRPEGPRGHPRWPGAGESARQPLRAPRAG